MDCPSGCGTNWLTIAIFVVLLVAVVVFVPTFYQPANLLNVARQSSIVGVVAIGMTFVILTGGIDLSVGSTLALSGVTMAMLINQGLADRCSRSRSPSSSASRSGSSTARCGRAEDPAVHHDAGHNGGHHRSRATCHQWRPADVQQQSFDLFNLLGSGNVFGLPGPFLVFLIVAVIGILVLRYLPSAASSTPSAAAGSGPSLRCADHADADHRLRGERGLTAALAGVMTASRLGVGARPPVGLANLDAITAVVIGGTSLMGGIGGAVGTVFGALLLAILSNLMNLIGISPFDQQIVKGAVIVLAVLFAMQATRKKDLRSPAPQSAVAAQRASADRPRSTRQTASPP